MTRKSLAQIVGKVACLHVLAGGGLALAQPVRSAPARLPMREPRPCVLLPQPPYVGDSLWGVNLWPGGIVPYQFSTNVTPGNRASMRAAMNTLEAVANIRFVPLAGHTNYLRIMHHLTENSSQIGMVGPAQPVNISNWDNHFIMCHELIHALGVYHEQSRSDRGPFVQINLGNVCQTCCFGGSCNAQFAIVPGAAPFGPYDFDSVMHYPGWAFTATGQPTISVLPPHEPWQNWIGRVDHLSQGDREGLANRYGLGPQGEQLILNGDFQSADAWTVIASFYADSRFSCSYSAPGYAYLSNSDGSPGNSLAGAMYQMLTIPAGATSALLRFAYSITTQETSTSTAYDFLYITIQNSSGTANLATIRLLSNLDRTPGTGICTSYVQSSVYDLSSFVGQTVRLNFLGSTDGSLPTMFRVDNVSVVAVVPVGACCVGGSVCRTGMTQSLCAVQGGTWQGVGSIQCSNCPPPPTGACCTNGNTCTVVTQSACAGVWYGAGTTLCSNCPPPPTGACCFTGGSCSSLSAAQCSAQGGTYRGDGTSCATANCLPPGNTFVIQPGPEGKDTFFGTAFFQNGAPDLGLMYFGGWGDAYSDYIEFDLAGSPSASATVSCILHLYADSAPNDPVLQVRRITQSWTETGVNLSNNPDSVPYRAFGPILPPSGWKSVDITDLYNDWKNGVYPNYGMLLVPTATNQTNGSFASSDHPDPAVRPKLVIFSSAICYPNCDGSTNTPLLTANDFVCFNTKFVAGEAYANCDGSTASPSLTANDFVCFITKFAAGCP